MKKITENSTIAIMKNSSLAWQMELDFYFLLIRNIYFIDINRLRFTVFLDQFWMIKINNNIRIFDIHNTCFHPAHFVIVDPFQFEHQFTANNIGANNFLGYLILIENSQRFCVQWRSNWAFFLFIGRFTCIC